MGRCRGIYAGLRCVAAAAAVALAARAQAPAPPELQVERGPGAADCPDAPALQSRLLAEGAQATDGPVRVSVRFEHVGDEYRATVETSGARSGVRTLSVRENHCAPLVDALAVSIVLLLDPDGRDDSEPPPAAAPPATAAAAPTATAAPETPPAPEPAPPAGESESVARDEDRVPIEEMDASSADGFPEGVIDLTPTFLVGMTPSWTVGAELGAMLRFQRLSIRLGGAAFLPADKGHAGGQVEGFLLSGRVSGCVDFPVGAESRLSGCATGLAARLRVEGRGYTEDQHVVRPLFALGPELAGTFAIGPTWGFTFHAAPLFLLAREESFFVARAEGSAFSVFRVSPWLGVGAWSKIF